MGASSRREERLARVLVGGASELEEPFDKVTFGVRRLVGGPRLTESTTLRAMGVPSDARRRPTDLGIASVASRSG